MLLSPDIQRLRSWITEVACQYAEPEDSLRDTADIVAILATVTAATTIKATHASNCTSAGTRYARVFSLASTLAELFAALRDDDLAAPPDLWLGEFQHACANMHAALTA